MKNLTLSLIIIATAGNLFAQTIPNAGFESWGPYNATYTTQVPTHWWGIDFFVHAFNSNYVSNSVVKSTQSHSGNFAVLCQTSINNGDTVNGIVISSDSAGFSNMPQGFAYSLRPSNITGYYKLNLVGGDSAAVLISMTRKNGNHRDTLVNQKFNLAGNTPNYTLFNFPLTYRLNGTPDTVAIGLGIQGPNKKASHLGTQLFVDDLAFTGTALPTGLPEITGENELISIYPNPVSTNAVININASINLSTAELIIYDVTGKQVRKINHFTTYQTTINCSGLNKGIYFYKLFDNLSQKTTGKFIIE